MIAETLKKPDDALADAGGLCVCGGGRVMELSLMRRICTALKADALRVEGDLIFDGSKSNRRNQPFN